MLLQQRHTKDAIELQVQRKIRWKAERVGYAGIFLLYVDWRIRITGMNVHQRTEYQLPRQRKDAPGHHAIRDIRWQDPVHIRPDYRRGEWNVERLKGVEVPARPAPNIGGIDLIALSEQKAQRRFHLPVVGRTVVAERQERLAAKAGGERIHHKEVTGVAVQVAHVQLRIFPEFLVNS